MAADIAPTGTPGEIYDLVCWNDAGLVQVVAQQHDSGEILMCAWADREALSRTLAGGLATYYSRSRSELWIKGRTSGNVQRVREVRIDCDGDALLYLVESDGPACHRLTRTCFSYRVGTDGACEVREHPPEK